MELLDLFLFSWLVWPVKVVVSSFVIVHLALLANNILLLLRGTVHARGSNGEDILVGHKSSGLACDSKYDLWVWGRRMTRGLRENAASFHHEGFGWGRWFMWRGWFWFKRPELVMEVVDGNEIWADGWPGKGISTHPDEDESDVVAGPPLPG